MQIPNANAAPAASAARLEIVVGIDPGTRVLGYGAIVVGARGPRFFAAGVLRAKPADVPTRLGQIRSELDLLFQRLKPTVIVVEQAFAARNVQSALRIGEGRGVVLGCAAVTGARIVQFAPAVAKKSLVGNGAADKSQVARMVEQLLGVKSKGLPLDASDALALALAFTSRSHFDTSRTSANSALQIALRSTAKAHTPVSIAMKHASTKRRKSVRGVSALGFAAQPAVKSTRRSP
ncbi:MAG: crossover junction endodeoxyribonuclease RuvC [Planctomycetota bacterium]|nr:crossover junction endodeoxyribonuclease RuvC [Planctomycetota bacterium]